MGKVYLIFGGRDNIFIFGVCVRFEGFFFLILMNWEYFIFLFIFFNEFFFVIIFYKYRNYNIWN